MPIIGLSDRGSIDPRFKEIGRIRKGAEKKGNRPGRDLDHFRYVPDSRHKQSADVFKSIYGDEPTSLEVYFPFDEMERNFSSWRESYGQNRLCKLRCDGRRWHDWVQGDRHYHSERGRECDLDCKDVENRCPTCPCQYVGRLSVILKPMWMKGQIGLVTVITSSINDIANLPAKLVQWEPLSGKPFTLWRETERIGVPIKGKRVGKDSDLLHLELAEDRLLLEFQAAQRREYERLAGPQPVAQLEAPTQAEQGEAPYLDYDGELIEGDPFLEERNFHGAPPDETTYQDLKEDERALAEHQADVAEAEREIEDLEPEIDLDYVPAHIDEWEPGAWKTLREMAVDHLGYDHTNHVKNTLKQIVSAGDAPALTYRAAWHILQEHQRSKQEESAESAA